MLSRELCVDFFIFFCKRLKKWIQTVFVLFCFFRTCCLWQETPRKEQPTTTLKISLIWACSLRFLSNSRLNCFLGTFYFLYFSWSLSPSSSRSITKTDGKRSLILCFTATLHFVHLCSRALKQTNNFLWKYTKKRSCFFFSKSMSNPSCVWLSGTH